MKAEDIKKILEKIIKRIEFKEERTIGAYNSGLNDSLLIVRDELKSLAESTLK